MTSNQKVFLGCAAGLLIAIVVSVGGCFAFVFHSFANFPEWAKRESVFATHKDLIVHINNVILKTKTLGEAQAALAAENWPAELVYINIKGDDNSSPVDAYKRYSWTSNSSVSLNGSGYGTLNASKGTVNIAIVDNSQLNQEGVLIKYTLYLEHHEPPKAP